MDIQLPDMDGITALRHIQANTVTAGLKVIAATASAMKDDEQHIRDVGFSGYINVGPVVAGVVGHKQYQFDLWATPLTPLHASRLLASAAA